MERELPVSASDRGGRSPGRSGAAGSCELSVLRHLALVDERDAKREHRGRRDRSDSAKCNPHQSFSAGSSIGTDDPRVRAGAEGE